MKQHSITGLKINGKRTYVNGILKPKADRRIVVVGYVEADDTE
jgi:hypothetical protein